MYSCIGCACVCVCWWRSRLAKNVPHMMSEKVLPCMKSSTGCTPSPGKNKTVPGYQGYLYPYLGYFNKAVLGTRVFCRGRTELTTVSNTGMDVVLNLPKCQLQVWIPYRTCQRVGYGYRCRTELTKGSGTGMDFLPSLPKGRIRYRCLYPYPYPYPYSRCRTMSPTMQDISEACLIGNTQMILTTSPWLLMLTPAFSSSNDILIPLVSIEDVSVCQVY